MNECCICLNKANVYRLNQFDSDEVDCPTCGKYRIARSASASIDHIIQTYPEPKTARAKLSHIVRNSKTPPELHTQNIKAFIETELPKPKEQADNLIKWIGNRTNLGDRIKLTPEHDKSITGSITKEAFIMIFEHLIKEEYLTGRQLTTDVLGGLASYEATVTFKGWEKHQELAKGHTEYRKAFMAMKFGVNELEAILENTFKPKTKEAGFQLQKLTDNQVAGLIDNRLRVEIQKSDFIIADLTHDNLGAYWEAGYAEGLGKPVIYTCEKKKFEAFKTHFDTNHHLTIIWDSDNPEEAGEQLKATIRATLPHIAKMNDD